MVKSLAVISALLTLAACGQPAAPPAPVDSETASVRGDLPPITVYKTATCSCCKAWVNHLRQAGFPVEARDVQNLGPIKERVGVPHGMGSCHTAEVGGYFVEGHVPAEDIKRLLTQRQSAKGLVVPAMPVGSPGMEHASGKVQPYDVFIIGPDGAKSVYAHHGG
jgi:hypothetical protein